MRGGTQGALTPTLAPTVLPLTHLSGLKRSSVSCQHRFSWFLAPDPPLQAYKGPQRPVSTYRHGAGRTH